MIEHIVKKVETIMMNAIKRYADSYDALPENVQIKITDDVNGYVFYTMCKDYKDVEQVSFLNILNKKIDLLGYQQLASPFLKNILAAFAQEEDCEVAELTYFICIYKETIVLAFYNGFTFKKSVLLEAQINELRM